MKKIFFQRKFKQENIDNLVRKYFEYCGNVTEHVVQFYEIVEVSRCIVKYNKKKRYLESKKKTTLY